ncbi:ATP-grasp fold amidoligase family protein [Halomonas hibernica]|uniref:ATP-grasp fold amidoligase family protein n=1 Tax=Halomonas hibernica TaxID=2591147 RepID=UPI00155262C3|nr:ATP-grasp fold amidoligase family protein [Halomonas hibernica]
MKKYIKTVLPEPLKSAYHQIFRLFFQLLNKVSPVLATKLLHFKTTGKWINLKNPKDFNEKLQWLKLNEDQSLKAVCADKYAVYQYIEENYDSSILNKLIAVYDKPSDVEWDKLPEKFAMKCNHGCAYNIVTKNKYELCRNEVTKKLNKWLGEKFGEKVLEPHYDLIEPKIIVEEYIENKAGFLPLDYKIYCFNGVAKLVLVCSEREDSLKLDFFDLEWNRLNIGHKENESAKAIGKPACFDEMVRHAEALAKPFTFVRVDFYDKDDVPVFGELTFTPAANMANYYNDYGLELLGEMMDLKKGSN